jgi:hypothetical protein
MRLQRKSLLRAKKQPEEGDHEPAILIGSSSMAVMWEFALASEPRGSELEEISLWATRLTCRLLIAPADSLSLQCWQDSSLLQIHMLYILYRMTQEHGT